jgi:porin
MGTRRDPPLRYVLWLALFAPASLCSSGAMAQQPETWPASWRDQKTMTGDWGGVRTSLEEAGVKPRAHFVTESAANPSGGRSHGARYTQQIDFGADLDLGRLAGLAGGSIRITLTDRAGRSLSADAIGNLLTVQEVFGAGQNFRLVELNYRQELYDKRLLFHIGWSPLGVDFGTVPLGCHFQNVAMCGNTQAPTNNSGWNEYPTGQWGAHVRAYLTPELHAATGIYQVNPDLGNSNAGFDLRFRGTGVIVPVEFGWQPDRGRDSLPSEYRIGGYFDTSSAPDLLRDVNGSSAGLTWLPFATLSGRWGAYAIGTQTIYREEPGSSRGLQVFAYGAMGDPETARYRYVVAGGAVYQGTFPGRDQDYVSAFAGFVRLNERLTRFQEGRNAVAPGSILPQTYEGVVEVGYGAQITPWFLLYPNVQYVIHPGGTAKIPNAFVFGLKTNITF